MNSPAVASGVMAVASFVLACVALLVAAASLGWQVTVWRKAVAEVVVRLEEVDEYDGDEEEHHVIVVVTNVGRAATTINEVGLKFHDASAPASETMIYGVAKLAEPGAMHLPKRVEPGEEFPASFTMEREWHDVVTGRLVEKVTARGYVRAGLDVVQSPYSVTLRTPSG